MANNPNYQRFFDQGKMVGLASKRSALLRSVFQHEFNGNTDPLSHNRITTAFVQCAKTIPDSLAPSAGFNKIIRQKESIVLLNGLILNVNYRNIYRENTSFDQETMKFTMDALNLYDLQPEVNSTHIQIKFAIARIDFEQFSYDIVREETDWIELDKLPESVCIQLDKLPEGTGVLCYAYLIKQMAFDEYCCIPVLNLRYNTVYIRFLKDH